MWPKADKGRAGLISITGILNVSITLYNSFTDCFCVHVGVTDSMDVKYAVGVRPLLVYYCTSPGNSQSRTGNFHSRELTSLICVTPYHLVAAWHDQSLLYDCTFLSRFIALAARL